MKKILIILCFVSCAANAQDSSKLKVSATIQARDIEVIAQYIFNIDAYEEMWDNIKAKFRVPNPPSGATNVVVDTVELALWADLNNYLKNNPYFKTTYNRVNAVLSALGQSWLTARLNEQEAYFNDRQNSLQQFGRQKLRKSNN